jgi:B9 domain-containing protein 2
MNVHFIGELKGANHLQCPNLSCHYKIVLDTHAKKPGCWLKMEGVEDGWTQICAPEPVVWNHPIDLHYTTSSVETWPTVYLELWTQDENGRNDVAGYGQAQLPASPGEHRVEVVVWRPRGTFLEGLRAFFLGGHPQLVSPISAIVDNNRFHPDFRTETMGTVDLHLTVVTTESESKGILLRR